MRRLQHRRVQFGHRGARRRHHRHRPAGGLGQPDGEEAAGPLVDPHVQAQPAGGVGGVQGEGERRRAGAGGQHRLADAAADQLVDEHPGERGGGVHPPSLRRRGRRRAVRRGSVVRAACPGASRLSARASRSGPGPVASPWSTPAPVAQRTSTAPRGCGREKRPAARTRDEQGVGVRRAAPARRRRTRRRRAGDEVAGAAGAAQPAAELGEQGVADGVPEDVVRPARSRRRRRGRRPRPRRRRTRPRASASQGCDGAARVAQPLTGSVAGAGGGWRGAARRQGLPLDLGRDQGGEQRQRRSGAGRRRRGRRRRRRRGCPRRCRRRAAPARTRT